MASEKARKLVEEFGHYTKYDAAFFNRHDADEYKEKLLAYIGELESKVKQYDKEYYLRELINSLSEETEQ